MENTAQHPPMNGDDDLAKTLDAGLQFEETPLPGAQQPASGDQALAPTLGPLPDPASLGLGVSNDEVQPDPEDNKEEDKKDDAPTGRHHGKSDSDTPKANSDLEKIKTSALEELRPLVSKLDLPAEEKFDTLLLIIRTTDDQSLLEEAHDAAKSISDDTRRAQALLDVIKEIDYFSTKR